MTLWFDKLTTGFHVAPAVLLGAFLALAPVARGDGQPPAAGKSFTVRVAPVSAKVGEPARAQVLLVPGAGYHINQEYPTQLSLSPPSGVTLRKARLGKQDAAISEQQARFEVVATAAEAGKKVIPGELRFAVCTATACDPQKAPVVVTVEAK